MLGNGKTYHRWTPQMENFLRKNYRHYGDTTLAEMMNVRYDCGFRWYVKHIEKKRKYLGLKRTPEEIFRIRSIWAKLYSPDRLERMWDDRGRTKIGGVKVWKGVEYIKTKKGFVRLSHHTWKQYYRFRKGYNVVIKDRNKSAGDIENLEMISNAELARRNGIAKYHPELRKAIWAVIKLNKSIDAKHSRPKRNAV